MKYKIEIFSNFINVATGTILMRTMPATKIKLCTILFYKRSFRLIFCQFV